MQDLKIGDWRINIAERFIYNTKADWYDPTFDELKVEGFEFWLYHFNQKSWVTAGDLAYLYEVFEAIEGAE